MEKRVEKFELVSFFTPDGIELKGVLSCPKALKGIIIYIHGLTDSFTGDYPLITALSRELGKINWGILAFNNRGAGLINRFPKIDKRKKKGYRSQIIGSVYEKFEYCQFDIEGARRFISETILCDNIVICGISTGANKAVYYLFKNTLKQVSGLILLSAVSDIEAFKNDFGKNFEKEVENAGKMVKSGKSDELMPKVSTDFPFSYGRFFSLVNTEARENTFPYIDKKPNFKALRQVSQPILLIYGANDEYMRFDKQKAINIFKSQAKKTYSIKGQIIRGANHGFNGKEKELASIISGWISNLPVS